jgi:hypothetical protein
MVLAIARSKSALRGLGSLKSESRAIRSAVPPLRDISHPWATAVSR